MAYAWYDMSKVYLFVDELINFHNFNETFIYSNKYSIKNLENSKILIFN